MLIKIPVAWLQARCARFVWKPHQNKAQVSYPLAVVAGHLAVANTQAEKVFRPLWESYSLGRNFYEGCSGLIEDLAVALSRKSRGVRSLSYRLGRNFYEGGSDTSSL